MRPSIRPRTRTGPVRVCTYAALRAVKEETRDTFLGALKEVIHLDGHEASVTASIGVSLFPDDADSVSVLVRNADAAMYQAKDKGRDTYQFFSVDTTPIAFGEPKTGERRSR